MSLSRNGWLIAVPLFVMAVALRLYSLDADPDWRLDWNPGLLTDEAFYMHNARNQVLFGQAHLDEFNNAVLSPLVHGLHVWVFSHFGVGYVQGRLVSVVLGLLSIGLFARILWLAFRGAGRSERAVSGAAALAILGAAWLAYEHLYLLYNRTALLETPAAFCCLLSLWCFAEAVARRSRRSAVCWGILAGLTAVAALATKLTTLPFVMALMLGAASTLRDGQPAQRHEAEENSKNLLPKGERVWVRGFLLGAVLLGVIGGVALWYSLWLSPHWQTWSRMQGFYLRVQGLPHSWAEGWRAIQTALIGERYGLMQFLFLHAPLAWSGSLLMMAGVWRSARLRTVLTPIEWVFLLWVAFSWLQMMGMRIAPTRYTACFIPAMVALLWVAVARWDYLRPLWLQQDGRSGFARMLILAWVVYFLLLLALPGVEWHTLEFPVLDNTLRWQLLFASLLMGGVGAWYLPYGWQRVRLPERFAPRLLPIMASLVALSVLLNTPWYLSYFGHRTYQLKAFNEALTRMLPEGSVLVGVAFETPFRYFFVFRGLCNDRQPPEAMGATHVLVVGSEETLMRFWTSGADLSRWYTVLDQVEFAAHPMLRGRVGPYRLLVYELPRCDERGWRESWLRPRPHLAPNTLLKPPTP